MSAREPAHFLARTGWKINGRKYKLGNKKVYLPTHVLSLVPPAPNQPPTLCTFSVPLKLNKLDMRDYLFNLYGLESLSVRSFINPTSPRRRTTNQHVPFGPWRRAMFKKMMTVELARPFYYPAKPEDLGPWDQKVHDKISEMRDSTKETQSRNHTGKPALVGFRREDDDEIGLEARRVRAQGTWSNGRHLDEKWKRLAQNALRK